MCLQGAYLRRRILPIYRVLVGDPKMGLPPEFEDVRIINIYHANGFLADNWQSELENKREIWIITRLHYNKNGRRVIRKTSGDYTWNARLGKDQKTSTLWREVPYKLKENPKGKTSTANGGNGLPNYTMLEFTPKEGRPEYALCKITRRSQEDAQKQGETCRSRGCMKQSLDNRPHLFSQGTAQNQSNNFEMVDINSNQNDGGLNEVIVKCGCGALLMPPTAVPQNTITIHPAPGLSNSQDIASPYGYNNTSIQAYNQSKTEQHPCILNHPSTDHALLPDWNPINMVPSSLGPTANQLAEPQLEVITNSYIYTAPHNGGQNSTIPNYPIKNSFPTIPDNFRLGEMNPNAMEQGSPRSISAQLFDARMAASPDGFGVPDYTMETAIATMMNSSLGHDHNHGYRPIAPHMDILDRNAVGGEIQSTQVNNDLEVYNTFAPQMEDY